MMAGASRAHAHIIKNLLTALDRRLDPSRWLVLADFGVDVGPDTLRYPDILVEDAGADPKSFTTASPVFVAEVLSPSTTTVDLGDKAAEYLKLASLAIHVVLSQDEPKAWVWVRGPAGVRRVRKWSPARTARSRSPRSASICRSRSFTPASPRADLRRSILAWRSSLRCKWRRSATSRPRFGDAAGRLLNAHGTMTLDA
jgi:Uma2 family endonuclease